MSCNILFLFQSPPSNKNIPQVLPDSFTFFSGTINQKLNEIKNRRGYYWGYHWNEIPQPSDAPDSIANQNKGSYYEIIGNDTASRFLVRCTLQDEPYNTFERFYILDISGQFYKPLTNWSTHLTNSDLIAQQIPATLLNGWTAPHLDNQLITYKIGNLYLINGIIQSPSTITENTYNVANLNLPFNFSGQGCVNISLDGEKFLYLTSYNDGLLHDQYRHTIPDSVYMIKGFFIH